MNKVNRLKSILETFVPTPLFHNNNGRGDIVLSTKGLLFYFCTKFGYLNRNRCDEILYVERCH